MILFNRASPSYYLASGKNKLWDGADLSGITIMYIEAVWQVTLPSITWRDISESILMINCISTPHLHQSRLHSTVSMMCLVRADTVGKSKSKDAGNRALNSDETSLRNCTLLKLSSPLSINGSSEYTSSPEPRVFLTISISLAFTALESSPPEKQLRPERRQPQPRTPPLHCEQ